MTAPKLEKQTNRPRVNGGTKRNEIWEEVQIRFYFTIVYITNVLANVLLIIKVISSRINRYWLWLTHDSQKEESIIKNKGKKCLFTILIRAAKIKWVWWEAVKKSGVRKIAQHYLCWLRSYLCLYTYTYTHGRYHDNNF